MSNVAKSILIVEDEQPLSEALAEKLKREGFLVLVAKDGAQGLDAALQNHPDLILLDIIMPVMDGMTMVKKLREDEWGRTARVMFLTNLNDNERLTEAMENEASGYIIKSDQKIEDILLKIRRSLGML